MLEFVTALDAFCRAGHRCSFVVEQLGHVRRLLGTQVADGQNLDDASLALHTAGKKLDEDELGWASTLLGTCIRWAEQVEELEGLLAQEGEYE